MKSLVLLLLLMLGTIGLTVIGRHSHCPSAPPPAVFGGVRHVVMATPPEHAAELFELKDEDEARDKAQGVVEAEREPAEGLPVPIYPGTRVVEAEILPPRAVDRHPKSDELAGVEPAKPRGTTRPAAMAKSQAVTGRISATEGRARDDAQVQLRRQVTTWLAPDVPTSWKPPARLIDHMVTRTELVPIEKDYGTLYEATLHVDASPSRRAEFIAAYEHERVARRITVMGGGLAAILACLAALAGFIRADEATKGYYTHWLRVAAAAGVGASGVLIYRLLA